jgi:hypothetical protein
MQVICQPQIETKMLCMNKVCKLILVYCLKN